MRHSFALNTKNGVNRVARYAAVQNDNFSLKHRYFVTILFVIIPIDINVAISYRHDYSSIVYNITSAYLIPEAAIDLKAGSSKTCFTPTNRYAVRSFNEHPVNVSS